MSRSKARLENLEKGKRGSLPWANVCYQDGVYWRIPDGCHDYRASIDPHYLGNQILSIQEVKELSKTHDFAIVKWFDDPKDELDEGGIQLKWEEDL